MFNIGWLKNQFKTRKKMRKKETDTIQLQNIWFKVIPNISFDALLGFEVISFLQLIWRTTL